MTPGVTIWRCVNCGTGFFPEPLLCRRCGGDRFGTDRVGEAVVEEVSVIRHMLGQDNWQPRRIASVRTADGQAITVGLKDNIESGATVELFEDGGAPYGRALARSGG
jgi:uncharacterized OB-fold protein